MIPQSSSTTVSPDSSAQNLLKLGAPFRDFPRTSILDLQRHRGIDGSPVPFSEWLTRRLQVGQPFVIQDFDKLETWDRNEFGIEKLIELSTKKSKEDTSIYENHRVPRICRSQGLTYMSQISLFVIAAPVAI
jgi:hypothetical protein